MLRIWKKPYTQICKEYVEDHMGRRDGMGLSTCTAYALSLKQTYRYMKGEIHAIVCANRLRVCSWQPVAPEPASLGQQSGMQER